VKLRRLQVEKRIEALRRLLEAEGLDAALIVKPENSYYFSGFQAIIYSRPIAVLVSRLDNPLLIVPGLDLEHAKERSPLNVAAYYSTEEFYTIIKKSILGKFKRLGIDVDSSSMLKKLEEYAHLKDVSTAIALMRAVKDEAELERVRLAAQITDLGMRIVVEGLQERKREIEIATEAEYAMKLKLAKVIGDDGIYPWMNWSVAAVLSGPRSFYPHGMMSGRRIKDDDVVVVTLDIAVDGYRAENERTFIVGRASKEAEEAFNIMEEAQKEALKALRPEAEAQKADRASREVFRRYGYLDFIKHRTGHSIGIEIHEPPYLAEGELTKILTNMVFCVEPGIYIPNVGGFRHSDTVLVTSSGYEELTRTPKGLKNLLIR